MQQTIGYFQNMLSKSTRKYILAVFLLSVVFQRIVIVKTISNVKLVHIIGAAIFPLAFIYPSKNCISKKIVVLISLLYLQTLLAYLHYGFSTWFLNMVFCTLTVYITWKLSDDFLLNDWLEIGKYPGLVLFVCITVNMIINWEAVWQYLLYPTAAHPWHKSFLSGGINEDSSWLALFSFLASGSEWWLPMITMVYAFSFLENSRAGLLAAIAFTTWAVVHWFRKKFGKDISIKFPGEWNKKSRIISFSLSIIIFIAFFLVQIQAYAFQRNVQNGESSAETQGVEYHGIVENLSDRLLAIGNEPGSMGRIGIWRWVPKEVSENIWGYGLGNGKKQIDENDPLGTSIERVDNVHSIYLQVLLEQGIIGFVFLLIFIFLFIKREIKTLACNPLAAYLLCYFCLGIFQDRFINVPMWFVVGAYISLMGSSKQKNSIV